MDIEMVNMLPPPPSGQGQVGLMPPLPPPPNDNSINVNELTPMKFLKKLLLGYLNDIQTQSINIVMGSSSDVSSILDSATELISAISHTSGFTVKQIPEWYEPSDKYINKNVLNINIDKPTFTKELKLDKDATGNTIITVKP